MANSLPLGPLSGWGLRDMLKLRAVCSSFRGEESTASFFGRVLDT